MPANLRPNGPLSCVPFFFLARVYTIIGAFFAFTAFTLCPFFEAFPLEIFHPQWLDVLCFIREVKAVKAEWPPFHRGALFPQVDVPVHHGVDDDVRERMGVEFSHDVFAVGDDRGQADVELVCNLLVDETFGQERYHFNLAGGEGLNFGMALLAHRLAHHVRTASVAVTVELEQVGHYFLFRPTDVEREDARHRGKIFTVNENNGAIGQPAEELSVLEIEACRHEIVGKVFRLVGHQVVKRMVDLHGRYGDDVLQDVVQSHAGQHVAVYDGHTDGGTPLHAGVERGVGVWVSCRAGSGGVHHIGMVVRPRKGICRHGQNFGCKSTTFASGLQEFWSQIRQKMMATPPIDLLHFDFESTDTSLEKEGSRKEGRTLLIRE